MKLLNLDAGPEVTRYITMTIYKVSFIFSNAVGIEKHNIILVSVQQERKSGIPCGSKVRLTLCRVSKEGLSLTSRSAQ
jgi:hypothetical protein